MERHPWEQTVLTREEGLRAAFAKGQPDFAAAIGVWAYEFYDRSPGARQPEPAALTAQTRALLVRDSVDAVSHAIGWDVADYEAVLDHLAFRHELARSVARAWVAEAANTGDVNVTGSTVRLPDGLAEFMRFQGDVTRAVVAVAEEGGLSALVEAFGEQEATHG